MADVLDWIQNRHIFVATIIIMVAITLPYAIPYYASPAKHTIVVYEKWTTGGSSAANYFFSDTYGNVYSVENSWLLLQYDMSERYAALQEGKTYEITTYGWRIKWLGFYPNAVKIELIGHG